MSLRDKIRNEIREFGRMPDGKFPDNRYTLQFADSSSYFGGNIDTPLNERQREALIEEKRDEFADHLVKLYCCIRDLVLYG